MGSKTYHLEYRKTASGKVVGFVGEYPGVIVQANTLDQLKDEAAKGVMEFRQFYSNEQPYEQVQISVPEV